MKRITTLYKNAYSGLSPATWWLSLVMLINRCGTMVVPFMTLYLTEARHYTIARAGMVMAIFGAGAVCGGVLGGKLTDKFGFYKIQLSALLCGGAMFLVLGQMSSFPAICICTFFLAVINESFRPANATAIAQYSNEDNRTRCYSLNRLAINLGWATGGALGGLIASQNYHLLSPARNSQTPSKKDAVSDSSSPSAYSDKMFLVFIVLTVLFGVCFFQLFATIPVFFKQKLHLTPFFIGCIMAFNGLLIGLFEMAVVFKLEQKKKNMHFITIGILLTGLSFVAFNLLPGEGSLAILSTCIVTAGEMLSMPFMNSFWIGRADKGNRGQYAGLYTASWSVAQVIGPYAGGQVAQHLGFYALWWMVGGVTIITAMGYKWLQVKTT